MQDASVVQKREERMSQFESCFRQFVNGDIKRQYTSKCDVKEKEYQHRGLCHDERFRNGRPTDWPKGLQWHNHEDDLIDYNNSMSAVNHHQTHYYHKMTRGILENNTLTIDDPIPGPSFKEVSITNNNNHHVCTTDTNGSTSERSFFGEFETYLDSFQTKFVASSCEDKSYNQMHSFTPRVTVPSNISPKGPPMVADSSACVHAPKTMRIDKKGTVETEVIGEAIETALKVTKKIIKSSDFGSDNVVGLPMVKGLHKHRKSTWDNHNPTPNGVLKSILKRRSNFKHRNYRSRKRRVTFAEGVLINREGLVKTSEKHPIKSDDIMEETFNQSSRKRPRIELTEAQRSLSAIVKRLKVERTNGKNDEDVPRAARAPVLWDKYLASKDARHRTTKSIPVVMSQKKSNASVVGYNNSLSEHSAALSSKGVGVNRTTTISKSPPAKMVLLSKERGIPSCTIDNSKTAGDDMPTRGSTPSRHAVAGNLASVHLFPYSCDDNCVSFAKLEAHQFTRHVCRTSLKSADYSPDRPLGSSETMDVLENEVYEEKEEIKHDDSRCESLKEDHTEYKTHRIMHGEVNTCEHLVHNKRNDEVVKELCDVHGMKNYVCESQSFALEKTTHRPTMNNCTKCNRKFKDIDNLQRHERAHSMEKLHACVFCKERFSLSSERNKHERTHGIEKTLCSCQD